MKKVKLGNLYKITSGGTPNRRKSEFYDGGDIPWIKTGDLKQQNLVESSEYITKLGVEKSSAKNFPKNTVLIAMYGATIGACSILRIDATTNQACAAFTPIKEVLPEYLYYFFKVNRSMIINLGVGGAQPNISISILKEIEILLPEIAIQENIVKILDKAQSLIDKRKEQIEACDELVKSLFYEMFGDPVKNDKGWKISRLDELGRLERGKSKHRPRNAPELLNGPYPLIQTGDVSNAGLYITNYTTTYSEVGLKQSKMWPSGTLCITIAANIAKTAILTFDACFPDSVVGFTENESSNKMFIQIWMTFLQQMLEETAPESAQKNINLKILNELSVITPPLPLQNKFAAQVEKIEQQKNLLEQSLKELENNFNSLMQRAFKGELF